MPIKKLKFAVGDVVVTPKGKVGPITCIGVQRIDHPVKARQVIIGIDYRVHGSYWAEWQLRKTKRKP